MKKGSDNPLDSNISVRIYRLVLAIDKNCFEKICSSDIPNKEKIDNLCEILNIIELKPKTFGKYESYFKPLFSVLELIGDPNITEAVLGFLKEKCLQRIKSLTKE